MKQCITGVKEHGVGVTLYRTIDTVHKGANLTIYCILSQLESFKFRHKCYPEKLYVQIDGGSENANQYLLAMMELLVVKRMVRLIYLTRLPTGHTHADIDACFAVIWKTFRSSPCETLQEYKRMIEESMNDSKLHCNMVDVMVIPDYKIFFKDCIDEDLSKLHKNDQTQHQWRFESVPVSVHFPFGVKTVFRAYSSDRVVELIKKPKLQCLSIIGQYTGLEAVTTFCRWYPSTQCDPQRLNIEGFYIIRRIPSCLKLSPQAFPEGCSDKI